MIKKAVEQLKHLHQAIDVYEGLFDSMFIQELPEVDFDKNNDPRNLAERNILMGSFRSDTEVAAL